MSDTPITIQDMEHMSFHDIVTLCTSTSNARSSDYAPVSIVNDEPPMTLNPNKVWGLEVLQHIYNNGGKCIQSDGVECTCPCKAFYKMNECKRGLFVKSDDRRN